MRARYALVSIGIACMVLVVVPVFGIATLLSRPPLAASSVFIAEELRKMGLLQARWGEKGRQSGVIVLQGARSVFYPLTLGPQLQGPQRFSLILPDCENRAEIVVRPAARGTTQWIGFYQAAPRPSGRVDRAIASAENAGISLSRSGRLSFAASAPDGSKSASCR